MRGLVNYFIKHSISGNLLMVLILMFGFFSMSNLRSTFFPQVPSRNIMIGAAYPGASAEEIEEAVVLKIEDQLKGVSGVERISSTTMENTGSINIEIKKNADIDQVYEDVQNGVDQINSFPVGLEKLEVYKLEQKSNAISFAITGDKDLYVLKDAARRVERELLALEGISKVTLTGFPDEEISIEFKEDRLREYNLTMDAVLQKIAASNLEGTGGTIKTELEEFKIRISNKAYYGRELKEIIVNTKQDGSVVKLKDVADIKDQWVDSPAKNFFDTKPSVNVDVLYTNQEDLLGISATVKDYIDEFNASNEHLHIDITRDMSDVVNQRIDMLVENGITGFVIVFLLLAMFLHYRLALWVALSIPISFAGMFILADMFGITINVISLFGMITVIGILVDDGVVISENIYRHFENGKGRIRAAIDGTMEVVPSVFSAIVTTIIVFSTFFLIDGRLGDFFGEMAFIVIATLLFSLVEGIFILPAHVAHSKALDKDVKPNVFMRSMTKLMDWMRYKMYKPVLEFVLKNRLLAVSIPIGLFFITIGAIQGGIISSTFFPPIEQDNILVKLKTPAGTRDYITLDKLQFIEDRALELNEELKSELGTSEEVIKSIDTRLGPTNSNEGQIRIELLEGENRGMKQSEIVSRLRTKMEGLSGYEELSYESGNPFGKPVSIAVKGPDTEKVKEVVDSLKYRLKEIADLKDVTDDDLEGVKEIIIELNDKAKILGFTERDILSQVRRGYYGGEIQRVQRGLDEVRLWVRYAETERISLDQLRQIEIKSPAGGKYDLAQLVNFSIKRGVISINRMDGQRRIMVTADIANDGVSASDQITNIQNNVLPEVLKNYPDVTYSFEGQSREQQKSMGSMKSVVPVILILMISVIVLTFRSWMQTLIVVLLIPFGFIGVAWGHYIHGMQLSLFSYLGMIALIGILINDSLVFVNAFNTNIKEGMRFDEAVVDAAISRFRPIVLTSITTIAGLAPLVLEKSFQAQFLIPMALSIAYGLAIATMVILILLPLLIVSFNKLKRWVHWYWYDEYPQAKEVEPAFKELEYEGDNH